VSADLSPRQQRRHDRMAAIVGEKAASRIDKANDCPEGVWGEHRFRPGEQACFMCGKSVDLGLTDDDGDAS